jgi:hypothetical protein
MPPNAKRSCQQRSPALLQEFPDATRAIFAEPPCAREDQETYFLLAKFLLKQIDQDDVTHVLRAKNLTDAIWQQRILSRAVRVVIARGNRAATRELLLEALDDGTRSPEEVETLVRQYTSRAASEGLRGLAELIPALDRETVESLSMLANLELLGKLQAQLEIVETKLEKKRADFKSATAEMET